MEQAPELTTSKKPPRMIPSITAGFSAIANNIYLILFPLGLDLILWFGPRLRIKTLMEPLVSEMMAPIIDLEAPELVDLATAAQELWHTTLEQFNLLNALRTFPVGIPSLMTSDGALATPLGAATIIEMPAFTTALIAWLLTSLIGLLFGCLFFSEIARRSNEEVAPFSLESLMRQTLHVIGLTLSVIIILAIIFIPLSVLISLFSMLSPALAQIAFLFISFVLLWLLVPLIFSPHGIFENKLNFLSSILASARLVRFTLPMTGMFILGLLLLSQGLNLLWNTPPSTSWMKIVGIAGHAFVSTGLLAASFIYYRKGMAWVEENTKRFIFNKIKNT